MDDSQCPISLDGTTLEGGGQLLRLALSFSSLTHIPIHVFKIRGNRSAPSRPEGGGGLKGSHLAAVEWLTKATNAKTEGADVKSKDLTFIPDRRKTHRGKRSSAQKESSNKSAKGKKSKTKDDNDEIWQDIYEGDTLIRRQSEIISSTPGSVFLILQAILPYLLFSAPLDLDQERPVPLRIRITGGTNVDKSMSYEYADQVLFPMLRKIGLPPIKMKLEKRGWTHGGNVIGSVIFEITPLPKGFVLPAFSFQERGPVTRFHASILAPNISDRETIMNHVVTALSQSYPDAQVLFPISEDSNSPKRLYLHLTAETSNGFRLGRDWMYNRKATSATRAQKLDQLVEKVVNDLMEEELKDEGRCVDEFMEDQLVVFQALAEGRSRIGVGEGGKEESLHAQTVKWVTERILGVGFGSDGSCEGVGFRVGERYWERERKGDEGELEKRVEKVEKLAL